MSECICSAWRLSTFYGEHKADCPLSPKYEAPDDQQEPRP